VLEFGDQLGSTAITTNSSGSRVAELRYRAWGETRYTWGATPTDYRFTGQREEGALGLYFYNARWYDPALGRFSQADSIIPNPYSPMDFDRYSYALNNPTRFADPSGHYYCETVSTWQHNDYHLYTSEQLLDEAISNYGVTLTENNNQWTVERKRAVAHAVTTLGAKFSNYIFGSPSLAFQAVYGNLELEFCVDCVSDGWGWAYADHLVKFDGMYGNLSVATRFVVHELGHLFDRAVCAAHSTTGQCNDIFTKTGTARSGLTGKMGTCFDCMGRKGHKNEFKGNYWGFAGGGEDWQFGQDDSTGEVWADMVVGWTFTEWGPESQGVYREAYMNTQMQAYMALFGSR
jgi:RHS repeat-associated protein